MEALSAAVRATWPGPGPNRVKRTLALHLLTCTDPSAGRNAITSSRASLFMRDALGPGWKSMIGHARLCDVLVEDPQQGFTKSPLFHGEVRLALNMTMLKKRAFPAAAAPAGQAAPRTSASSSNSASSGSSSTATAAVPATPAAVASEDTALLAAVRRRWGTDPGPCDLVKLYLARHLASAAATAITSALLVGPHGAPLPHSAPLAVADAALLDALGEGWQDRLQVTQPLQQLAREDECLRVLVDLHGREQGIQLDARLLMDLHHGHGSGGGSSSSSRSNSRSSTPHHDLRREGPQQQQQQQQQPRPPPPAAPRAGSRQALLATAAPAWGRHAPICCAYATDARVDLQQRLQQLRAARAVRLPDYDDFERFFAPCAPEHIAAA